MSKPPKTTPSPQNKLDAAHAELGRLIMLQLSGRSLDGELDPIRRLISTLRVSSCPRTQRQLDDTLRTLASYPLPFAARLLKTGL